MGNFDLGTRLLPEIEFHRRRERERERDRFQLHSFLPSFLLLLQALSNVCRSRRRF